MLGLLSQLSVAVGVAAAFARLITYPFAVSGGVPPTFHTGAGITVAGCPFTVKLTRAPSVGARTTPRTSVPILALATT